MKKILIANRGEIAVRIIRTCKEMGIKTVAVHSLADKDSLHAKMADQSVCIGPGPSIHSYLNIPNIMSAAEITGVDAIHPGYGFLAENSRFAAVCEQSGITFIGPTSEQIRQLGDKIAARKIAQEVGVPLLPGSKDAVLTLDEAARVAAEIGYPVIVKATAGGGGKGMKIAESEEQLMKLFPLAQSEAQASFGNPVCYIEKYLSAPRHVEAQILGDAYGRCVFLGERDCSIQRRHQKVIEEAPCPVFDEELRAEFGRKAVMLAQAKQYRGLGTVEFLYQDGKFYFMEMNTRVQVEHPVTEMITGLDLIKEQILVACGERLRFPDKPELRGHSLECRINAEDPVTFAPWPGKITGYHQPGGLGVRVDSMVYAGYTVPSLYDSMIAKVITFGGDRMECVRRMERALFEMKVEGIRTNISFHTKVLASPRFQSGDISTHFLAEFL